MVKTILTTTKNGSPFLTKFIRLWIYSFFDFKSALKTLSLLSKQERQNLKQSAIARNGKKFPIYLNGDTMA